MPEKILDVTTLLGIFMSNMEHYRSLPSSFLHLNNPVTATYIHDIVLNTRACYVNHWHPLCRPVGQYLLIAWYQQNW